EVLNGFTADARTALDRTIDVVLRHGHLLRFEYCVVQRRIAAHVGTAQFGGHLDVLDELGPRLRAPRVDDSLLVLGRRPLGLPGPISPLVCSPRMISQGVDHSIEQPSGALSRENADGSDSRR